MFGKDRLVEIWIVAWVERRPWDHKVAAGRCCLEYGWQCLPGQVQFKESSSCQWCRDMSETGFLHGHRAPFFPPKLRLFYFNFHLSSLLYVIVLLLPGEAGASIALPSQSRRVWAAGVTPRQRPQVAQPATEPSSLTLESGLTTTALVFSLATIFWFCIP